MDIPVYAASPAKQGTRSGGTRTYLAVLGLFIVLSAVLTYPLVKDLGSVILGAPAPGDNFEYVHKIWWFKHALFDLRVSPLFDRTMFYPFGYNLALSETTVSNTIPALPLTLLHGEVVAYNLTMLVSFVLSGLGMYLLVLHLTGSRTAGLFSGIVFAFCPYRMAHLGAGHLPLMGTQWLPLLVLYLDRMLERQSTHDAFMAALFYGLGALSSWYYAYMFALTGGIFVLLRSWPWRQHLLQWRLLRCVMVFAIVALVFISPLAVPVARSLQGGERPNSLRYLDQFSASPLDFVYPNVMHPLWGVKLLEYYKQNIYENTLYIGWLPLGLAILALRRQHGKVRQAFAWLGLIFAIMAMGTTLHWSSTSPVYIAVPAWVERVFTVAMGFLTKRLAFYPISSYSLRVEGAIYLPMPTLLLYLYLPFFSAMRVWARLGLITVFAVSVLAGYGLDPLCAWSGWRGIAERSRVHNAVVSIAALVLVILDFAVFPFAIGACKVQDQPVYLWLARQDGDFAVMMYPTNKAIGGLPVYETLVRAKKKAVYGQGTFFPRAFNEHRAELESFPSEASIVLLKDWEVRYVLIGANWYGDAWPQLEARLASNEGLRFVGIFDEQPIYYGDRVLRWFPVMEPAFIVDRIYVYEIIQARDF